MKDGFSIFGDCVSIFCRVGGNVEIMLFWCQFVFSKCWKCVRYCSIMWMGFGFIIFDLRVVYVDWFEVMLCFRFDYGCDF